MGDVTRSDSIGQVSWPVKLAGGIGAGAGVALGQLVATLTDLHGFWPGLIAVGIGTCVGIVLGQLAGSLVSRRPQANEPRT